MRALVLSGGAAKGSFHAGALQYLLGELGIKYDLLCGVSAGAINAAFLSTFPLGKEKEASIELSKLWSSISPNSIYKPWRIIGIFQTIWRNGFYDSSPLRKLIRDNISVKKIRNADRKVSIGAVSLTSGKYTVFNEDDNDFVDAVIASASFPTVFQPIKIRDELWIDGGVKSISPLHTAIDLGATEIDVIMTSPIKRDKKFIKNPNTLDIIARVFDLFTEKIMSSDIEKAVLYNKLAALGGTDKKEIKINIIRPKFNLVDDLLDFDPKKIQEMMKIGFEEAKKAIT